MSTERHLYTVTIRDPGSSRNIELFQDYAESEEEAEESALETLKDMLHVQQATPSEEQDWKQAARFRL